MPESHTVERPAGLLTFLFACHPDAKKTRVRQWLKHGSIAVNGEPVTHAKHALQAGDVVSIRVKGNVRGEGPLPPGMTLVFEDSSLLVVEKPEDLLSVGQREGTGEDGLRLSDRLRTPRDTREFGASVDRPPVGPRDIRAHGVCKDGEGEAHSASAVEHDRQALSGGG